MTCTFGKQIVANNFGKTKKEEEETEEESRKVEHSFVE